MRVEGRGCEGAGVRGAEGRECKGMIWGARECR